MEILGYIVDDSFKGNAFVMSVHKQVQDGRNLSLKQVEAIENILEIELDFFDFEFTLSEDHKWFDEFSTIREKLFKNNFRKVKPKNNCIRAIQSIIDDNPRELLIDQIINPQNHYSRY